jgi:hypothetical protein
LKMSRTVFPTLSSILTEHGSQISDDVYSDRMVHYECYKLKVKDYHPLEVEDFRWLSSQFMHCGRAGINNKAVSGID